MSATPTDEKKDISQEEMAQVHGDSEFKFDPFTPFPDDGPAEQQLTFRAVIIGCILGAIVGASNLYLGLKTGFTFGASLFGAIFGFAILKPLSLAFTGALSKIPVLGFIFGGTFGPKENCTVQTAATAAGGLGIIFVSAVPALYRLGLMADNQLNADGEVVVQRFPSEDYGKLYLLTFVSKYGIPAASGRGVAVRRRPPGGSRLRRSVPTPTASAVTIRNLHDSSSGASAGKKKAMAMGIAFFGAMIWYILGFFAPGIIRAWHIFDWMARKSSGTTAFALQSAEDWSWYIEWTPAFIGAGMLSGVNASYSLFLGSFMAWGLIGPALVRAGLAIAPFNGNFSDTGPNSYRYFGSLPDKTTGLPTPRYWMLWPGVAMMLFYSFAELAMNARSIGQALVTGSKELYGNVMKAMGKNTGHEAREDDDDPALPQDQVPTWLWTSGVAISSVVTILVMFFYFKVSAGETILAIILAFFFAFIGLQSAGDTDINPISAVAKASQLIFGGVSKAQGLTGAPAQTANLIGGTVAGAAAAQAVDMVGDLKTGYLLNATPISQFYAQLVGAGVSVFISVPLFVVFTKAYPCILYEEEKCDFGAPSVSAWAAVATVLTGNSTPIPNSSGVASIILSILSVVTVILKHRLPAKFRPFVPNMNAIGIAFILPSTVYGTAMVLGATLAAVWQRRWPSSFDMFAWAIAAGLTAGEGIGGLVVAIFQIAGLKGENLGTAIGCPTSAADNTIAYCG
ncbi:hypothetical protein HDU67_007521 [Dinochytrium kinnereticum]|nr:hypothetical protein HDU67_007521 [Dinochytrium kinnereticum]